jgi:hypothetical protein
MRARKYLKNIENRDTSINVFRVISTVLYFTECFKNHPYLYRRINLRRYHLRRRIS